jgi:hypothetical protein
LFEISERLKMPSVIHQAVLSACRQFMTPIIRLLLKNGIGYREFSDVCKSIFVDVASDDYGIRGRKTNMSRVAVMTGISRKEVRRVRDSSELEMLTAMSRTRRPEQVLSIWHTDPNFLDSKNRPKRISFEAAGPSFRMLVDRVGGDIPPRAMLNELLRAGSVVEEGGKLLAISRSYIPEPNDPQAILVAGEAMRDLASTIYHNLGCVDPETRFLERRAYSARIPRAQRARFRKFSRERGELFLRDLNAWLAERETASVHEEAEEPNGQAPRIGVGVYFFDDAISSTKKKMSEKAS